MGCLFKSFGLIIILVNFRKLLVHRMRQKKELQFSNFYLKMQTISG